MMEIHDDKLVLPQGEFSFAVHHNVGSKQFKLYGPMQQEETFFAAIVRVDNGVETLASFDTVMVDSTRVMVGHFQLKAHNELVVIIKSEGKGNSCCCLRFFYFSLLIFQTQNPCPYQLKICSMTTLSET